MGLGTQGERIEILSSDELRRTLMRLASQVLESVGGLDDLVLLGIRSVAPNDVLAPEEALPQKNRYPRSELDST